LLKETGKLIENAGYKVNNLDATIIAQKPKMLPHIEQMRENISKALNIDIDKINIKATTEEGLGFTGEMLGISSQCIASVKSIIV
jgi:2-C-methyl-D-erythritol 2,4-cyclodiphosphate synthase